MTYEVLRGQYGVTGTRGFRERGGLRRPEGRRFWNSLHEQHIRTVSGSGHAAHRVQGV